MGVFGKAKEARMMGGKRIYFDEEGDYRTSINKIDFGTTPRKGLQVWGVEVKVIEAKPLDPDKPGPRVGQSTSWATLQDSDYFWNNIKTFVLGLLGLDEEEFDENFTEEAFEAYCIALSGKHQVAAGMLLDVRCRKNPSGNNPDWVNQQWIAVDEEQQNEAGKEALAKIAAILSHEYPDTSKMDEARATVAVTDEVDKVLEAFETGKAA